MITLNFSGGDVAGGSGLFLLILLAYALVWILTLALALTRLDFHPVDRLTWVVVIILVPLAGMLLYLVLAPSRRAFRPGFRRHDDVEETPWEDDPAMPANASLIEQIE